jgi:hypothetical protein
LVEPQRVVQMFSDLIILDKRLALLNLLSSTSRWYFVVICKEFSKSDLFSELKTQILIVTCVSSQASISKWYSMSTTLKFSIF